MRRAVIYAFRIVLYCIVLFLLILSFYKQIYAFYIFMYGDLYMKGREKKRMSHIISTKT